MSVQSAAAGRLLYYPVVPEEGKYCNIRNIRFEFSLRYFSVNRQHNSKQRALCAKSAIKIYTSTYFETLIIHRHQSNKRQGKCCLYFSTFNPHQSKMGECCHWVRFLSVCLSMALGHIFTQVGSNQGLGELQRWPGCRSGL